MTPERSWFTRWRLNSKIVSSNLARGIYLILSWIKCNKSICNVKTKKNRIERCVCCRSAHEIGRGYPGRGLYLELERNGAAGDLSPPSDNVLFDNQCYATTPSSSNGNSDLEQPSSHYPHARQGSRHMHHHQVTLRT